MYIRCFREISKLELIQIVFELENIRLKTNIFYL